MGGRVAVPVPVAEEVAVAEEVELALCGVPVGRPVAAGVRVPTLGEGVADRVVEPVAVVVEERHRVGEAEPLPLTVRERVGEGEVEGLAVGDTDGGGAQYPKADTHEDATPADARGLMTQDNPVPQVPQNWL